MVQNVIIVNTRWGQMGWRPYMFTAVIVLSRRPSISTRFWLTVEVKTGARYCGVWIWLEAGDAFFYKTVSEDNKFLDDVTGR